MSGILESSEISFKIKKGQIIISNLEKTSVKKVIEILKKFKHPERVIELRGSARSAMDAADSLKVPVGAIVKTLVFVINNNCEELPIITLVAGDKICKTSTLPKILNLKGSVTRPDARKVKEVTGYSIGGVSPIGLPSQLDLIIDTSLKRFDRIWSAAGHTRCVFPSTFKQLSKITNSIESDEIT